MLDKIYHAEYMLLALFKSTLVSTQKYLLELYKIILQFKYINVNCLFTKF